MAEVDKAVQTLQNMWYMAVVNGLGLNKSSFMLLQSGTPLPYETNVLWQVIDALPPKALTSVMSLGSLSSFYHNYGSLFSPVFAPESDDFKRIMGDQLNSWQDYQKTLPEDVFDDADKEIKAFSMWAKRHLPSHISSSAISIFSKDILNIVNASREKYRANSDFLHPFEGKKGPLYKIKISDITQGAIAHGPKKEIHLNSKTSSSDVSSTWAKGGVSGFLSIFSLGGSGNYSNTTRKFVSSDITIDATFQHVLNVQTFMPGDWYNSGFLNYAFKGKSAWSVGNPLTWESVFGPDGNLQRFIEGLIIVDGIEIVMKSSAIYSMEDRKEINSQIKGGIWPFFSTNASGGFNSAVNFDDQGRMIVKTTCPVGSPAIFGANVGNFPAYITNQNRQASTVA
ncbi:hypothetical protein [Leclercia sp.]|uniref:hypothetical protein n=1 Tax=Leclercia sp. TaxID=1898428 RepID=UPI002FDEFF77